MRSWIEDRFGSRRGFVRFIRYQASWWLWSSRVPADDLPKVTRLVFVCKGNICRSATAEAVARALDFPASSYGMQTHLDKPANPGMAEAAAMLGYDLSAHRTTPLELYERQHGDLVLVFEPEHLRELKSGVGKDWNIDLLGAWARPRRIFVHDPFGGTARNFEIVAEIIRGAVDNLVRRIRRRDG
jgi:protein-tyrosine phosphatase